MSELKTRPTGADVEAFLAAVPDARRRADGQTMAALMTEVTGETARMWGPSIVGYGTYRYRDSKGHEHEWFPVGFSPRKAELTLYILNDHAPYAELIGRLGRIRTGVSCIYMKRLSDIDHAALRDLIERAWRDRPGGS